MLKKMQLLLCGLLLLLLPNLAFAENETTFSRLYHSDEPILTVLTAKEGTVLAVVDDFPILEEDVDFIYTLDQALGQAITKEEIFNRLLEDRALHSQARALGLLPTDEEVDASLEQLRAEVLPDEENKAYLESLYTALAISEDEYWYGFERYNRFHLLASSNLYTVLKEQGLAAKAPYLDEYYVQKLLQWKQSCPLTISPDCPYTAVTDTMVKPYALNGHQTLYGDRESPAPLNTDQICQDISTGFFSTRTLLFIVIASILILAYALIDKRLRK